MENTFLTNKSYSIHPSHLLPSPSQFKMWEWEVKVCVCEREKERESAMKECVRVGVRDHFLQRVNNLSRD